jgi:hypothetical protein
VSWTDPTDNGGLSISYYEAKAYDATTSTYIGQGCKSIDASATSCTVPGLTNGGSYYFVVAAVNSLGYGPYSSASATITPLGSVPGTPTGVTAAAGSGSATVSWTDPTNNGDNPNLHFNVEAYDATTSTISGQFCTVNGANATSCTVSGLTYGVAYYFTVTGANLAGFGPQSSASNTIFPFVAVPGAPTGVTAAAGNGSATVSWTDPTNNGGSPITSYDAVAFDSTNAASGGQFCTVTGATATSCTVQDLTNGDIYYFEVFAINSIGLGPFSGYSTNVVIPTTPAPTAPGTPAAVAGNASATVFWADPTSNGGSAITYYVALAHDSTNAANGGQTCTVSGASATSCTVSGLTNRDTYYFTIVAANANGFGPFSSDSNTVLPTGPTAPGLLTGVIATAGNASATVTWIDPRDNGGSAITSYDVLAYDLTTSANGGESCTATGETATSCTVPGLTNGDKYYFTAVAVNSAGAGPTSAASPPVTPAPTSPGAPTGVTATPGMNSATVTWTDPTGNGGSAITYYGAVAHDSTTASNGGQTCYATGPTATSCTVSGLINGDKYYFTVAAFNSVAVGSDSSASPTVTPAPTVPGAPTGVTAAAGNASALVTWTDPTGNGGSAITSYAVTVDDVSSPLTLVQNCTVMGASATSCNVPNLVNGDVYFFQVAALNAIGQGVLSSDSNRVVPMAPSTVSSAPTVPGAPTGVTATPGMNSATVFWTDPASNGGAVINYYSITATDTTNPAHSRTVTASGATATSLLVTGLMGSEDYYFTVAAENSAGLGLASGASSPVVPA